MGTAWAAVRTRSSDQEQGQGNGEHTCHSSTGYGSAAGPGPGPAACATEAVLVLASACVLSTARGDDEVETSGMLPGIVASLAEAAGPGCAAGMVLPGDADGVALAPCVVKPLAAAQLLERR